MCRRSTHTSGFDELAGRFGVTVLDDDREDLTPRYNTAPSLTVPVVVATGEGPRLLMARRGCRRASMKGAGPPPTSGTGGRPAAGRTFKAAPSRGPCLGPPDGFYEWKAVPGQK